MDGRALVSIVEFLVPSKFSFHSTGELAPIQMKRSQISDDHGKNIDYGFTSPGGFDVLSSTFSNFKRRLDSVGSLSNDPSSRP